MTKIFKASREPSLKSEISPREAYRRAKEKVSPLFGKAYSGSLTMF